MSDDGAQVVGIPMLVRKGRDYWFVLGEDGARFKLVLIQSQPTGTRPTGSTGATSPGRHPHAEIKR